MSDKLKNGLFLFLGLWALLAFIAWHYESTCGGLFSPGCTALYWDAVRWVVLGKWIAPYQTLISGVAAVVAGGFVLIAARTSAKEARDKDNQARKEAAKIACSVVGDEFRDAQVYIGNLTGSRFQQEIKQFRQTPSYIAALHAVSPMLGSIVSAQLRDANEFLEGRFTPDRTFSYSLASGSCQIVWHLLQSVAKHLEEDGTFDLYHAKPFPAGPLRDTLKRLDMKPSDFVGIQALFDWDV